MSSSPADVGQGEVAAKKSRMASVLSLEVLALLSLSVGFAFLLYTLISLAGTFGCLAKVNAVWPSNQAPEWEFSITTGCLVNMGGNWIPVTNFRSAP